MTKDGRLNRNTALLATFLAGALFVVACHSSEVVAPDGATISLSANPAQVIVQNNQQLAPVEIIATVRDAVGVPLPGQDVRFTTTNGVLTPQASTPVTTDKLGNAFSALNGVIQAPSITATSGKATANLSLTVASAAICSIVINPVGPQPLTNCSDPFVFSVTVSDCSGKPVQNARMVFLLQSGGNKNAVTGNFTPSSDITDSDGTVSSTLNLNSTTCNANCPGTDMNGNNNDCSAVVVVQDQSGVFSSQQVPIVDNIN